MKVLIENTPRLAIAALVFLCGSMAADSAPQNVKNNGEVKVLAIPSTSSNLQPGGKVASKPQPVNPESKVVTKTQANKPQVASQKSKVAQSTPKGSKKFPLNGAILLSQDSSAVTGDTFSSQNARKGLLIDPLVLPSSDKSRKASPSSTFGVPSAYGASWRNVFVGGGFIGSGRAATPADGSISFGAGFGDSVKSIGVELDFAIISLSDAFADSGSIGFKVHKVFPELDNLAVAAGWSNPITWGAANDAKDTFFGVVTKAFDLMPGQINTLPLTVTTGIGTGAFRSVGAIKAGTNDPNFFGSLGLKVIPEVSLVSTWTGNQLNSGISAAPFPQIPFVLTVGAGDVTDNRGNGTRLLINGGFGFTF